MSSSLTQSNLRASEAHIGYLPQPDSLSQKPTVMEGQPIRIAECRSWEQLKEHIPAWEAILGENSSLSIFSTPEWLGSWWKAFGSKREVLTLALFIDNHTLVGLIPCYLEKIRSSFLGELTWLRFIGDGSGDSDNLDFIVQPGFETVCAQGLMQWLTRQKAWDVCSLNTIPETSQAAAALHFELKKANWPGVSETSACSSIQLQDSWAHYLESLSPGFRPLVTRYPRKLAQKYQIHLHRCGNPEDLQRSLEVLFCLHKKRWDLVNEPGSFGCQNRRHFYFEMGQVFLRRGWLEFWLMELNGVPAAAQYCFRYRDTVYILQEGFEPKFAADKPGYALRAAMLRHFIQTGVKQYDFLGGLAPHKQNWGAKPGAYLNLRFARPASLGSVYLTCTNATAKGKEWLRSNLPEPAWSFLHWMKSNLSSQQAA